MLNENYIVILYFMTRDLKLKGSELLVYALIYGFSQDNQSKFYGSRKYIADWFNCSLPTIDKALNGLLEKGFIIKETETINGVIFNRYRCNKEILGGIKKLYRGGKETLYNNTIYNKENSIINNTTKESFKRPSLEEIENYIKEKDLNVDPKQFYDYFEVGNWKDSKGNQVKNWKQKLLTWNKYSVKKKDKALPSWYGKEIKSEDLDEEANNDFKEFLEDFRK